MARMDGILLCTGHIPSAHILWLRVEGGDGCSLYFTIITLVFLHFYIPFFVVDSDVSTFLCLLIVEASLKSA
jgi:hypothetical protein